MPIVASKCFWNKHNNNHRTTDEEEGRHLITNHPFTNDCFDDCFDEDKDNDEAKSSAQHHNICACAPFSKLFLWVLTGIGICAFLAVMNLSNGHSGDDPLHKSVCIVTTVRELANNVVRDGIIQFQQQFFVINGVTKSDEFSSNASAGVQQQLKTRIVECEMNDDVCLEIERGKLNYRQICWVSSDKSQPVSFEDRDSAQESWSVWDFVIIFCIYSLLAWALLAD